MTWRRPWPRSLLSSLVTGIEEIDLGTPRLPHAPPAGESLRPGRLQVHAGLPGRQAGPPDQLLFQPTGRGAGDDRAPPGDLPVAQAAVHLPGGDRGGEDRLRAPPGPRR